MFDLIRSKSRSETITAIRLAGFRHYTFEEDKSVRAISTADSRFRHKWRPGSHIAGLE